MHHGSGNEPHHVAVAGMERRSGCRAAGRARRAPRDARPRHAPAPGSAASASRRGASAPRGAGWPVVWTSPSRWVMTSMPRSISMFWMSMTSRSLPGIAHDEKITRSPALRSIAGCSSRAMRAIAARGSPCDAGAEHHDLVARQGLVRVLVEERRHALEHARARARCR